TRLIERGLPNVLLDVEHLFDGQSIFFYFLGESGADVDAITTELAEVYEAKAQIQKFADTLITGCGPHCGTDEAEGCGSSCSSCAVVGACGTRAKSPQPSLA